MHSSVALPLLALSWLCGYAIGSPVKADVLPRSDAAEVMDSTGEGSLFVPSLEEHGAHLIAIMGEAYNPEALACDSLANP